MSAEAVKAEWQHIVPIADNLREADALEVKLSSMKTPYEAISNGFVRSDEVWTILRNNDPIGMFGVCSVSILGRTGVPWLLGTDEMLTIRKQFLKESSHFIDKMLAIRPHLVNFVHVDNSASIRWLRWMDFTIHPAKPAGPYGALFHKFERSANV